MSESNAEPSPFELEYASLALKRENTHIWGTSPVIGPDGRIHLYVAQWERPEDGGFGGNTADGRETSWHQTSEIAHYVGDSPEGPFEFVRMAVPHQGGTFCSPHNPSISFVDGTYVLLFIVNEGSLETQRILMYVSDGLEDDWRPAEGAEADGTILRKSTDPGIWDHEAMLGNSNPSLIKHHGTYMIYFKGIIPVPEAYRKHPKHSRTWTYGVALSDTLEGPYTKHPERVTKTYDPIEDACVFSYDDRIWMFTRDMREVRGGGGLLWVSDDGMEFDFDDAVLGFHHLDHYIGKEETAKMTSYRLSQDGHLERPQMLFRDGKPAYLYMASGLGYPAPYGSASHVFRIRRQEQAR